MNCNLSYIHAEAETWCMDFVSAQHSQSDLFCVDAICTGPESLVQGTVEHAEFYREPPTRRNPTHYEVETAQYKGSTNSQGSVFLQLLAPNPFSSLSVRALFAGLISYSSECSREKSPQVKDTQEELMRLNSGAQKSGAEWIPYNIPHVIPLYTPYVIIPYNSLPEY